MYLVIVLCSLLVFKLIVILYFSLMQTNYNRIIIHDVRLIFGGLPKLLKMG